MTPIAVAVVNYNTREHLHACLATIRSEAPDEVLVVDNASSDGSAEMIQASYPWVTLLANKTNPGYGAAANQAIASCASTYVLLLNSDTRLAPGSLRALSTYLDRHPAAAIVGPRLVNPDGSLQVSCFPFPTPLNTFLRESIVGVAIGHVPILRERYLLTWSHMQARIVPWVLGAALAIRREAFEAVGGFDESFFMYFEEIDLCFRLSAAGWQTHFAPVTSVMHVGGASTIQHRSRMAVQLYTSMSQYFRRHYPGWWMLQFRLVLAYLMIRNIARDIVRLYGMRQVGSRARLEEDLAAWKQLLFGLRGESSRIDPLSER